MISVSQQAAVFVKNKNNILIFRLYNCVDVCKQSVVPHLSRRLTSKDRELTRLHSVLGT